jgi:hypothetical protein
MAKRTRRTITGREDNPVPKKRSKKKQQSSFAIIIVIGLIAVFLFARTRTAPPTPQRVVAPR